MLLPGPAKLKALQPVWKLLQRAQGPTVGSCKRCSWLPGLQHLLKGCNKLLIAHLSDPAQNASQPHHHMHEPCACIPYTAEITGTAVNLSGHLRSSTFVSEKKHAQGAGGHLESISVMRSSSIQALSTFTVPLALHVKKKPNQNKSCASSHKSWR